jgi:hypothetical protein
MVRRRAGIIVAVLALGAREARAQDAGAVRDASASSETPRRAESDAAEPVRWPARIPGLDATVNDPRDGRVWTMSTRVRGATLSVVAAAQGGQLAIVFEQRRGGAATCAPALAAEARAQQAVYTIRAEPAQALRGPGFDPESAFQLRAGGFDLEYGCVEAQGRPWIVTAMASARAGVTLSDAASMTGRIAESLRGRGARGDGTIRLETSGLDLGLFEPDEPWLFTGEGRGFPLAGDVISTRAGDRGGVTMTVAMRAGRCAEAWDALRVWLTSEGQRVDRPAYIPAAFGPRIRRVTSGERLREVYCAQPTPERALVVSAVFLQGDDEASARMGPMLERLLRSATPTQRASPLEDRASTSGR